MDSDSETRRQGDKELDDLLVSLSPGLLVSRTVVDLRADWPAIGRTKLAAPCNVVGEQLAYVIYTSGSTGRPKGAMNTHRGVVNRLRWMQDTFQLGAADRVLQKTPISFDVSAWELFWPLISGARLVLARPGGQQDSTYLAQLIGRQRITTLHFVPAMLQVFLAERDLSGCRPLRRVICSGEALPIELQERFFARLTAELHNLYGPTEAAIDVTAWACRREVGGRSVPIGRPIANTQIYLLDRLLRPVPIGVTGELYIGGVQLARGYLRRPDQTAERFIPNPFGEVSGARYRVLGIEPSDTRYPAPDTRLYKTGDLARFRPDGAIEFLGRIDHQIKLRGFRIELGEIEAALAQHAAVREAVVVVREERAGDARLVAYVVPDQGSGVRGQGSGTTNDQRPTTNDESVTLSPCHLVTPHSSLVTRHSSLVTELRAFLTDKLPDYMLPAHFMLLDALPLSPSGKVDRCALPAPDESRVELPETLVPPGTSTERIVAEIWQQVLGFKRIGIHDNFFTLGGHSLLVAQLMLRLRDVFQVELPLRIFFEQPTIVELALTVDELLLEEVAALSEEEAQALVASMFGEPSTYRVLDARIRDRCDTKHHR